MNAFLEFFSLTDPNIRSVVLRVACFWVGQHQLSAFLDS